MISVPSEHGNGYSIAYYRIFVYTVFMAYDGFTMAAVAAELREKLNGGYLAKIMQPEKDALLLTFKTKNGQRRLLLSASASLPLVYLTETNRKAPLQAPVFCMLLRKYIGGARLLSVEQPGLERVLILTFERRDEMGDLRTWKLTAEIMGKHSNLILLDSENRIVDAIKRIPGSVSSVREVLPGRTWFIPNTVSKTDPFSLTPGSFRETVCGKAAPLFKAVYTSLTGFSPVMAEELCWRARVDGGSAANTLAAGETDRLDRVLCALMQEIRENRFSPTLILRGKTPVEFAAVTLTQYKDLSSVPYESMSELIESYYTEKEKSVRIRQRSADLRHVVQTILDRDIRTLTLQEKQMQDTEKKDKYRLYGELLHTYGYSVPTGSKKAEVDNYYTNEKTLIPLDPLLTPQQNAEKYYARYTKLKRTAEALESRMQDMRDEIRHLETIAESLETAADDRDLSQIRQELADCGYIRQNRAAGKKQPAGKAEPLHYRSSDGYDIYVGKNNYQNEEVSFRIASGNDWWFHAKNIPGSHVIVKADGKELPDRTFEEAGRLAAYYSGGRLAPKVEIDYTLRRNLKKPPKARPGFVIYHTNYSLMAEPDISGIEHIPS